MITNASAREPQPRDTEVLTRHACLTYLRTQSVGRLAFTRRALPDIVPVNYVVDGDDVLIQLDPESAVARAVTGTVVAFQADDINQPSHIVWTVTLVGEAVEILDPAERERVAGLSLTSWARGRRDHLLRISAARITGRLLMPGTADQEAS